MEVLGTHKKSKIMLDYIQEISEQEWKESNYTASDGITKETEERGEMKGVWSYCALLEARKTL